MTEGIPEPTVASKADAWLSDLNKLELSDQTPADVLQAILAAGDYLRRAHAIENVAVFERNRRLVEAGEHLRALIAEVKENQAEVERDLARADNRRMKRGEHKTILSFLQTEPPTAALQDWRWYSHQGAVITTLQIAVRIDNPIAASGSNRAALVAQWLKQRGLEAAAGNAVLTNPVLTLRFHEHSPIGPLRALVDDRFATWDDPKLTVTFKDTGSNRKADPKKVWGVPPVASITAQP